MVTHWKWIFICACVVVVYFAFGIAQKGQNTGFFVGLVSGAIIVYLFLRYKDQAQANMLSQKQKVSVNVAQNVDNRGVNARISDLSVSELLDVLDSALEHKQLLPPIDEPGTVGLTPGEQLALALRSRQRRT